MTGKAPFFPGLAATLVVVDPAPPAGHGDPALESAGAWLMKGAPWSLVRDGVADEAPCAATRSARPTWSKACAWNRSTRVADVRLATLEAGGKISVVPNP
jgi:hypothetical protein